MRNERKYLHISYVISVLIFGLIYIKYFPLKKYLIFLYTLSQLLVIFSIINSNSNSSKYSCLLSVYLFFWIVFNSAYTKTLIYFCSLSYVITLYALKEIKSSNLLLLILSTSILQSVFIFN